MASLLNMFDYPIEAESRRESRAKTRLLTDEHSILPPEPQQGNIEYKLKLINPSPNRLQQLVTQMKWRLEEGLGEALYEIGVEDNGVLKGLTQTEVDASMQTLNLMAKKIGASVSIIREKVVEKKRKVVEALVRKISEDIQTDEIRALLIGNEGSGKSSLLGVLTQGENDNGRGRARLNLFRHRHEIRTGRTSSINKEILGFDASGSPITYNEYQTQEEICQLSAKIIVFIDSCGHRKYLKTTVFSLTAMHADYAILVVNALTGIDAGTNKQHLSLALALELPFIIVVNKIDLCHPSMVEQTLNSIRELVSSPFCKNKSWLVIEKEEDIASYWRCSHNRDVVPIFLISCVNGANIDLLYKFLRMLKPSMSAADQEKLSKEPTVFQIDETFNIQNVGIVVSGFQAQGLIEEGNQLQVGPLDDGSFVDVYVTSLQRHKVSRRYVRPGESSTLAIACRDDEKSTCLERTIRKGMVLLGHCEQNFDSVCDFFKADIFVMPNSNEISNGFQAMVYIENVRQCATVVAIENESRSVDSIAPNESGTVVLQFCRPQYIRRGCRLLIQQGMTKAVGRVTQIYPWHQMT